MKKKINITWDQLKVGDEFSDGSKVLDIKPWSFQKCYELKNNKSSIIASYTHLFKCEIYDKNNNLINKNLELSEVSRIKAKVSKNENKWICTEDIFESFNEGYKILLLNNKNEKEELKYIKIYKNGDPQRARCISTTTGFYEINGFISHNCGTGQVADQINGSYVIMSTLDGWITSPIIQEMKKAETTEEMRHILYKGLKDQYLNAGIKQDDFNIQMTARKLTSYKRTSHGLEPINPGEKADIVSMATIGNYGNIFKVSELSSGYKYLTKPLSQNIKTDAVNQIIG